jgi:pyridoxal phosphate enzyme (YggS family)
MRGIRRLAADTSDGLMSTIADNTRTLLGRIELLGRQYGRAAGSVTLVGVAKTQPPAAIREACQAGLRHVGENYLQEALPKLAELADLPITWHFVGRIQSNKTAAIAAHFDWVHSIDRLRVAERLDAQRPAHRAPLECCIEVNLDAEPGKGGVAPAELTALALAVATLPRLRLRGLMLLPAQSGSLDAQRRSFARLREALLGLRESLPGLDALSMGMSGDMEAAIAEGATMVRIGTALFGARTSA